MLKRIALAALLLLLGISTAFVLMDEEPAVPAMAAVTATPTVTPTVTPTATPTTTPTAAPTATPIVPGGVLRLTAQGYQSELTLYISVDDDKVIRALTVDASGESAGLGQKCGESRWTDQFIGQTGPFVLTADLDAETVSNALAIDAVSYATVTSRAIVEALNQLCELTP